MRAFAVHLAELGHSVIVQPVARKTDYQADPGIVIVPMPWKGGDQELASMNFMSPRNWLLFLRFFIEGTINTFTVNKAYRIERTICMWAVPSGVLGLAGKIRNAVPYDIWVLGSDIWRIRKIPVLGKLILKTLLKNADRVFADGIQLCNDVQALTGVPCAFLPSSRTMPVPNRTVSLPNGAELNHFLFVGRYHPNKGPDLLIKAIGCLPDGIKESIRVHLFGIGPLEEELSILISRMRLERYIRLNGPIDAQEFSNYLQSVSFLVIPSRIESIPVVFSDALQRGTPVVAMPVGDLENLIKKYKCGVVAEAVTPEALASALQKALAAGKDSFAAGVVKAGEQFEMKNAVTRWLRSRELDRPT